MIIRVIGLLCIIAGILFGKWAYKNREWEGFAIYSTIRNYCGAFGLVLLGIILLFDL